MSPRDALEGDLAVLPHPDCLLLSTLQGALYYLSRGKARRVGKCAYWVYLALSLEHGPDLNSNGCNWHQARGASS